MIITIPVDLPVEGFDKEQEFQMDVIIYMNSDFPYIRSCFIEDLPLPTSEQSALMDRAAQKYLETNLEHLYIENDLAIQNRIRGNRYE